MPPNSAAAPPMNFRRDGLTPLRTVFFVMPIVLAAAAFPKFFADHRSP
jgi:hypothetical protein